ncbi:PKD domain-containing protein, partial [Candidatus Woesearchaeota archaeon]|nr:PKD domain-containing protein [Candidatus Woesearchaeota archaeon]
WYRWNVQCSDGTNSAFAAADFTFQVNTSAPDSSPVVTALASPVSGDLPLVVQFNATVVGGDAPLSFEWDFDNDGTTDSTAQNPIYIYNVAGTYTAVVNVSDVDGDWDTDNVTITVSSSTHDIAVNSITDSKVGSTAYLWDLIDVTSNVQNQGTADETVTVQLEVDGVVVNSTSVAISAGATVPVTLNFNAAVEGFNTVIMRAVPVAGETDLSDQSQSTSIRVWSVEDVVSNSTREIFLSSNIVLAGGALSAFLPVQNSYGLQGFDDLRVELWSSDLGAFTLLDPQAQLIDLSGGAFALVQWDMTAVTPGVYVMSASLGNDEIDHTEIMSKIVTVV